MVLLACKLFQLDNNMVGVGVGSIALGNSMEEVVLHNMGKNWGRVGNAQNGMTLKQSNPICGRDNMSF